MYWWKTKALAEKIKTEGITEAEAFPYFFVQSLFLSLASLSYSFDTGLHEPNSIAKWVDVSTYTILMIQIAVVYRINNQGDGKDFFKRWFALGLPITVRCMLLSIPFAMVIFAGPASENQTTAVSVYALILQLLVAWRMMVWMKRVST